MYGVGLQFVNGSSNLEIGFGSTFEIEILLNLTGDANKAITREQKTNDDEIKTIEWQGCVGNGNANCIGLFREKSYKVPNCKA